MACGLGRTQGPLMGSGEGAVGLSTQPQSRVGRIARQVVPAWGSDPYDPRMPSPAVTQPPAPDQLPYLL